MLKLDNPKQVINRPTNPLPQKKITTIQSRLHDAEKADYKEYQERIASESNEVG